MASTSASSAVSEVLRQLAAYRKKLLKEKGALDAKLAAGVKTQLDATREALLRLQSSRAAVAMIREEMLAVEKLKAGAEGEGDAFDKITRVSGVWYAAQSQAGLVRVVCCDEMGV
jgi:exocyst complex component 3